MKTEKKIPKEIVEALKKAEIESISIKKTIFNEIKITFVIKGKKFSLEF